jgi:hypothetical protein
METKTAVTSSKSKRSAATSVPNEKFGTNEAGESANEKEAYPREIAAAAPNLVPQQFRYELSVQDTSSLWRTVKPRSALVQSVNSESTSARFRCFPQDEE